MNLVARIKALVMAFHLWRLSRTWLGGRAWYQYVEFGPGLSTARWSAGDTKFRTQSFLSFLERENLLTEDDVVLDIGSNAGLFSLAVAAHCRMVYGIEIDRGFAHQAAFLKGWWSRQGRRTDNVRLIRGNVADHASIISEATVIFASKVLYHAMLREDLDKLLRSIQDGPARLVVMQGHDVRGTIGQDAGMRELMEGIGFEYRLTEDVPEFPIAIARRASK